MLIRLCPNYLRNFPAKLRQNVGICQRSVQCNTNIKAELRIPLVNATVGQWPSVQQLIAFCSCCHSAMEWRWMTAPECSSRRSRSCISFWNSAYLCHVRGGKTRKKRCQIVNTLMKYGVDWHLHVCKGIMGNSHQTRLQCENDLIRQPFQLS